MDLKEQKIRQLQFWIFTGAFILLYMLWIWYCMRGAIEAQYGVFFRNGDDFMADLFNVMYYSRERAPYTDLTHGVYEKAYFPLSYVICYVLAAISGLKTYVEYDGELLYTGEVQSLHSMTIVIGVFFIAMLMVILAVQIYNMAGTVTWKKWLITIMIMASGIMMFTYERGNLILLALIGVLMFLAGYDSENRWLRELGYIGLAVAGALKGYPAILGLLLVYRREWKNLIRLVVYGILMAFVPFLLLKGGFSNIPIWLENLHMNSEMYIFSENPKLGYLYFISYLPDASYEDKMAVYQVCSPIITVLGLYAVISSVFQKKAWIRICTLLTYIIIYPKNSGLYCLIYLVPVILLYLNEEEKTWKDLLYLPIFVVLLTPLQFLYHEVNRTILLDNMLIMVLLFMCLAENTAALVKGIREHRKKV